MKAHVGLMVGGKPLDPYGNVLTNATMTGDGWRHKNDTNKWGLADWMKYAEVQHTTEVYGLFASCLNQEEINGMQRGGVKRPPQVCDHHPGDCGGETLARYGNQQEARAVIKGRMFRSIGITAVREAARMKRERLGIALGNASAASRTRQWARSHYARRVMCLLRTRTGGTPLEGGI